MNSLSKKTHYPLRILHIGNIANNAYLNAKILNEEGFDCDVICYDYYHIMGCPEWEEVQLSSEKINHNRPNWKKVTLNGYKRPRWFAQGSMMNCIQYLIEKRKSPISFLTNQYYNKLLLEANLPCENLSFFLQHFLLIKSRLRDLKTIIASRLTFFSHYIIVANSKAPKIILLSITLKILRAILRSFNLFLKFILVLGSVLNKKTIGEPFIPSETFESRVNCLIRNFSLKFPDRLDKLTRADLEIYKSSYVKWCELISHYDLVIGYATDPIYPLLVNTCPYIAFEHGTIRDIPFENSSIGRLTALAYAEAKVVYMTNADSINQAQHLSSGKIIFGLHGFDSDSQRARIDKALLSPPDRTFYFGDGIKVFFAPSRQHWKSGFPTWRKGNDFIVYAARDLAKKFPGQFRIVFVEWGAEVSLTKELIRSLGLDEYFVWIQPLSKADLLVAYRSVDCIIDQFVLPCIGSITLDSIALGNSPVITLLDDDAMTKFYGETIPLLNCKNPLEVYKAMSLVMIDDSQIKIQVEESNSWFKLRHSGDRLRSLLKTAIEHSIH